MKKTLLLLLMLGSLQGRAQLRESEKLVYVASYSMSGLMTQLAQVTLETKKVATSKSTFLHLRMEASTFSKWDSYFRIRDVYESYVNPQTLAPSLYKRNVSEGGYTKVEKYIYQPDGKTISSTVRRRNGNEQSNTFTVKPTSVDIIAAIYRLRTVDFSKFKPGQTVALDVVFDEKEIAAQVKYVGKETISAGKLGKKECYKLSLSAKTEVLTGKDKNLVWFTADEKRIPVFAQFSIPVGTGQLELTSAN